MEKSLFLAKTKADLEKCFPVIKELRPHLSFDEYLEIYNEAHSSDGYEIVAIQQEGQILAVMGYRVLSDFVRGKHIYIDDLISSEKVRSKGLGAKLLTHAEAIAEDLGCKTLRLCTGIENERGVSFYEKNGWTKRAYAYTKKLKSRS
jgi:ribosomal protein S18 acetylase RimI-like enzyme